MIDTVKTVSNLNVKSHLASFLLAENPVHELASRTSVSLAAQVETMLPTWLGLHDRGNSRNTSAGKDVEVLAPFVTTTCSYRSAP